MMNQMRTLNWISDNTDRRVAAIKAIFHRGLQEHTKNFINYYDFLLVAKKLNFRFEESSHLMELRKFFFNHKNQLLNKKLVQLLCIEQQSLQQFSEGTPPEKMQKTLYLESSSSKQDKFNPSRKSQIKINREEEDQIPLPYEKLPTHLKSQTIQEQGQQYHQKLSIILSIKVSQMLKKIKILMEGTTNYYEEEQIKANLMSIFVQLSIDQIYYELFKKGVVSLLRKVDHDFVKEKLTMSEDDIKAVFTILDDKKNGYITINDLELLKNQQELGNRITKFYQARINKRMVKNTLFKLGKNANNIQIYQVKNVSLLQFKNIQEGLVSFDKHKQKNLKPKIPHFGPIKGNHLKQSSSSKTKFDAQINHRSNNSSLSSYKHSEADKSLDKERQKIQKIIRGNKQQKKKNDKDTIANKLRKLFIHKVILPRERLLQQQKMKYLGNKSQSTQMIVKLI